MWGFDNLVTDSFLDVYVPLIADVHIYYTYQALLAKVVSCGSAFFGGFT